MAKSQASLEIREARPEDAAGTAEIENEAIANHFAHFGTTPVSAESTAQAFAKRGKHPWVVSVEDGQVLGFARASSWKDREAYAQTCETGVYVRPGAQGKGIGRKLYDRLFAELKAAGFRFSPASLSRTKPASASTRRWACVI